jgi:single stranded DNA-binding protein
MTADNHTSIVGNLVDHPELRFTNNGIAVANMRVAVTQRIQQDGQWRDGDTSFLKVNVWRGQAEHLADSLPKGDRVMVTGRLRQRSWETPEGDKRSVTEIEADEVGGVPQVGYRQGRADQSARQRRTSQQPGAADRAGQRLQRRPADLLNLGRSPGSAAHRVPGCRQVAPQTPLPSSGWLKNGCAVLPAPDREWLNSASVCQAAAGWGRRWSARRRR